MYYYLFYKLYKFSEAAPSRWWSEWKASLSIDVLELFICLTGIVYYSVFTKKGIDFGNGKLFIFILGLFICLPNYFIFHHGDQWKDYVKEFDQWPKRKNRIGGVIIWSVIILIIANLIFSFYLMSQIDWKEYR